MKVQTLFFDLDGTLVDPREGITKSIQYALEQMRRPVLTAEELFRFIGPSIWTSMGTILGTEDRVEITRGVGLYRERYNDVGVYENEVYPGIPELLARLAQHDVPMFIATVKPHPLARKVLQSEHLDAYFSQVYGAEFDGSWDDKGALLGRVLEEEEIDGSSAAMIGDRSGDIIAGKKNGMYTVGVLWGFGAEGELDAADLQVASPESISDALAPELPFTE